MTIAEFNEMYRIEVIGYAYQGALVGEKRELVYSPDIEFVENTHYLVIDRQTDEVTKELKESSDEAFFNYLTKSFGVQFDD